MYYEREGQVCSVEGHVLREETHALFSESFFFCDPEGRAHRRRVVDSLHAQW